ncbi:MAG: dethiobiotin synthase [Victivallaceae bacterium]
MNVFISGTDTNVGKTIISSWLALHMGFAYFKPIQTGTEESRDSETVVALSGAKIYPESFSYRKPISPHLAANIENDNIDLNQIVVPQDTDLIVEGIGGVLVPLNSDVFVIDLIRKLEMPVLLVACTRLGTINHTLLSLEVLRSRNIEVLGVIMNGKPDFENKKAIESYGNTTVVAEFPIMSEICYNSLKCFKLPDKLNRLLTGK